MRLPMHQQREIARLHTHDPSQSDRQIARATGVSSGTVGKLRNRLRACPIAWQTLREFDDDLWQQTLSTRNRSIAQIKPRPDWSWVDSEMQRDGATLQVIWCEWRELCPQGVGYTQFASGYRRYRRQQHIVMRRAHRAGEKLYVDFSGQTVDVCDPNGGPVLRAQIFVGVLGYSNYTFLMATASQSTADWVRCHVCCFEALGGVPEWVVSDNLKAAVLRREKARIVFNPAYRDCLAHYDTAALPTGVRKPKGKAKVEVGVQLAQRWVLFRLRNRVFFSLDELNGELGRLCAQLNAHPFKKLPGSRQARFEASERGMLKPLPATSYELCEWRYAVRVAADYHVEHKQCFYSVDHALAGETVDLRIAPSSLEIFCRGRRVALHAMLATAGESSTLHEHRPPVHQRVLEGEPKALMAWADAIGPGTQQMVRHHLQDRSDAANGLACVRRLRDLGRLHGDARIEQVCAYALARNITALRSLQSILKTDADRRIRPDGAVHPPRPDHDNLRGPAYFRGES